MAKLVLNKYSGNFPESHLGTPLETFKAKEVDIHVFIHCLARFSIFCLTTMPKLFYTPEHPTMFVSKT